LFLAIAFVCDPLILTIGIKALRWLGDHNQTMEHGKAKIERFDAKDFAFWNM